MTGFWQDKKILITGGAGFLGRHVVQELILQGAVRENIFIPELPDYDLRKMADCEKAVAGKDIVLHLAGVVGGIEYNLLHPGKTFFDNAAMALNILEASRLAGVKKFVGIGTVCEYPKFTEVPFKEKDLWLGYPEETNAPYGLSKKMMLVQGQAYRQEYGLDAIHLLMLNLYGPYDNFDPATSHVIPALIRKVAEAKKEGKNYIEAWGTGKATRDFLFVEDAARGIVLAAEKYQKPEPVNLGSGMEISIKELAELIANIMDFKGEIRWDKIKPDGQPRRCLDTSLAEQEFGFKAQISFEQGLKKTINWYLSQS